jgi:hypothetical protein
VKNELILYDHMCAAIEACHSVRELKDWHDKAQALAFYARQAQNVDAERKATEIRLRAERKAGRLLREQAKSGERDAGRGGDRRSQSRDATVKPSLSDYGISRSQSSRWQALANVDADQFEHHLADRTTMPTTNGILRAANGTTRMDDASLWLWGHLRDFERDGRMERCASELYAGMTATMQADVRRILPALYEWLAELGVSIND